jgi:hypothetical protein
MRLGLCVALLATAILHQIGLRAEAAEAPAGVYVAGSWTAGAGGDLALSLTASFGEPRAAAIPGIAIDGSSRLAAAKPIKAKS